MQRLAEVLQCAVEYPALCVQPIELHIQARQLVLQAQACYRQVIRGRLRLGVTGCHLVANFAPQVEVVTQGKTGGIAVVHRRLRIAPQRSRIRLALAQRLRARADLREQASVQLAGICLRCVEVCQGGCQVGVGLEQLLLQVIQRWVVVELPPFGRQLV